MQHAARIRDVLGGARDEGGGERRLFEVSSFWNTDAEAAAGRPRVKVLFDAVAEHPQRQPPLSSVRDGFAQLVPGHERSSIRDAYDASDTGRPFAGFTGIDPHDLRRERRAQRAIVRGNQAGFDTSE